MRYRANPQGVYAVQWDGGNTDQVADLIGAAYTVERDPRRPGALVMYAGGEGWAVGVIDPGWWIVKDGDGRLRTMNDERFHRTHKAIDESEGNTL